MARREDRQRFWAAITEGVTTEDAGAAASISFAVAALVPAKWRHALGQSDPAVGSILSFVEREEIALLRASGLGVRPVARRLHRAPSTISHFVDAVHAEVLAVHALDLDLQLLIELTDACMRPSSISRRRKTSSEIRRRSNRSASVLLSPPCMRCCTYA